MKKVSARNKLNRLHLVGDILLAGIVGLVAQSWGIFLLAAIVLVGLDLNTGQIRPRGHHVEPGGNRLQDYRRRGGGNHEEEQ